MFNESLTQLGLSKKEALLYLLLLRNGPSPASLLAKRLGMKRVSLYPILEALGLHGLVSFEQTPLGRRYISHDPVCLLDLLERENADIKYRMDLAKQCVQQLRELIVWKS
ncbi:MAG: helix-turn-helix domain-containing protein [Candidatus Gracilibacteria bacterium]